MTTGRQLPAPCLPAPAGSARPYPPQRAHTRAGSTPSTPPPPAPASPGPAAGTSSPQPLATFDPATRTWRTWPDPPPEDPRSSKPTWPRCGTTRRGYAYPHPTWEPSTAATRASFSTATRTLPTPCARDGKGRGHQRGLPDLVEDPGALLPTPTARGYGSNRSRSAEAARRPSLARLAGGLLPTPAAAEARASANATAGRTTASRWDAGRALTDATRLPPTPRSSDTSGPGRHGTGGPDLRTAMAMLPTPRSSDGVKGSPGQRGSHGDLTLPAAAVAIDTDHPPTDIDASARSGGQATPAEGACTALWGPYTEAVDRWRRILGRPSPAPTQPGRHSRPVLAPRWVEWLMGLPDGWVTELGLPRTVALRLLGNGVVPQQAAAALRTLLILHAQQPTDRP